MTTKALVPFLFAHEVDPLFIQVGDLKSRIHDLRIGPGHADLRRSLRTSASGMLRLVSKMFACTDATKRQKQLAKLVERLSIASGIVCWLHSQNAISRDAFTLLKQAGARVTALLMEAMDVPLLSAAQPVEDMKAERVNADLAVISVRSIRVEADAHDGSARPAASNGSRPNGNGKPSKPKRDAPTNGARRH